MTTDLTKLETGNDVALPDDIREELLAAQMDGVTLTRVPRVGIMPAAAGLYEFEDTNDTLREFEGIILNAHPRNVLWDSKYGEDKEDEEKLPACSSPDGKTGIPREGFPHAALNGQEATGEERIPCATCPYNKWRSKALIDPDTQRKGGKAVTNRMSLYLWVEDRVLPVELVLPPTSLGVWNKYVTTLTNHGKVVQQVVTKFSLTKVEKGNLKWSEAKLEPARYLSAEELQEALAKRQEFFELIRPWNPLVEDRGFDDVEPLEDEEMPF